MSYESSGFYIADGPDSDDPQLFVDLDELARLRQEGLVNVWDHPTSPLKVGNYTSTHPLSDDPTPLLRSMRGLVFRDDGLVIARPYTAMRELAPGEALPVGDFTAYEKLDGSMGTQYTYGGSHNIATRRSFKGRQAVHGSELLAQYQDYPFDKKLTYVWEIIAPDEHSDLVVDYGDRDELVLTGIINTLTGEEKTLPDPSDVPFKVVESVAGVTNAEELLALEAPNAEGFVVKMHETGERIKVKFPSFDWFTAIKRGTMMRRAWDGVRVAGDAEAFMETVPRLARDNVAEYVGQLLARRSQLLSQVRTIAASEVAYDDVEPKLRGIVQRVRKGLDPTDDVIWGMLKPPHVDPNYNAQRFRR